MRYLNSYSALSKRPPTSTAAQLRMMTCALFLIVLLIASPAAGEDGAATPTFPDGARCLFIGHSFFVPVAKRFDHVARRNDFSKHRVDTVFSPGLGGSPGRLWDNERHRKRIKDILATGEVELLGMTATGSRNSEVKHYQQWIELALKHNPKTQFFIGQGWMLGGPRLSNAAYQRGTEMGGKRLFDTVARLREAYPKNHIYFMNYGKMATEMKSRFDAGKLPDVTKMVGRDAKSLFLDRAIGHGGPMMVELSALCWLNLLYGADATAIEHTPYEADVAEITTKVIEYNQKYK